jgi:hypothetical protein
MGDDMLRTDRMLGAILFFVGWSIAPANGLGAELVPVGVDRFFVTPGQPSILQWKTESDQPPRATQYTLHDYRDQVLSTGTAQPAEGGLLQATLTLREGYYEIEFPESRQRFGVMAVAAYEGQVDLFFAIDAAMSWLVSDDDIREGLVKILARAGVGMSRERLRWSDVGRPADTFDWDGHRRYETLRHVYRENAVEVLEMFHDAPGWLGRVGKYPEDLVTAASQWQQIARRWRPTWGALEVWNEPEIMFGDYQPADQYVPLVRTISYQLQQAGIDVPVVGGVFAHYQQRYLDTAAANGFLDAVDVVSFHTYGRAPQMETLVGNYRQWLAGCDREAIPLWITECGRPWSRGTGRPPVAEDAESALDITMKAVEARCCGIARHFPFVYPYYEERESNFGMMGRRATPLRAMAAYVQLVDQLAHKQYLGDLRVDAPGLTRARVFAGDQHAVAVLYTGKVDADAAVQLDLPSAAIRSIQGIDGRPLEPSQGREAPIPDGLTYRELDREVLTERLVTDTPAMRLWKAGRREAPRPAPLAPVLLRFTADAAAMKPEVEGYRVRSEAVSRLPLRVKLFNLDGKEHQVKLSLPDDVHPIDGSPGQSATVPPGASAEVVWQVDLGSAFTADDRTTVRINATSDDPRRLPPLVLDFFGGARLDQIAARYPRKTRLPIDQSNRWTAQAGADGKVSIATTEEAAWQMRVEFGEGDRWAYPRFELPPEIDLGRAEALVLRARCVGQATVRVFLWEGDTGTGYLTPGPLIPADGQWYPATVRFRDLTESTANTPDENHRLDLDRVRRISIGLNSDIRQNVLEVSDVYVVGGD